MPRIMRDYTLAGFLTAIVVLALYARIGFKSNVLWFEIIMIFLIFGVIKLMISPNFQLRKFSLNLKQIDISVIVLLIFVLIVLGIWYYFSLTEHDPFGIDEMPFGIQISSFMLIISAIQVYIFGFRKKNQVLHHRAGVYQRQNDLRNRILGNHKIRIDK
jgi:hypothetical protein